MINDETATTNEERYAPYVSFLGLPAELNPPERAKVVILPIPYDLTTSYQSGARRGPLALLEASTHLETWDEELERETWEEVGIATAAAVVPDTSGPAATMARIERAAAALVDEGRFVVGVGGEHSVSAPLVRAARRRHPSLGVLQLDAHADLRDSFEGSPHNHACVMHRILDDGVPISQVGVRSLTREEHALIRERNICSVPAIKAVGRPVGEWIHRLLEPLPQDVYVTVDLDVFDPSVMPSTGTPEPGGLDWYKVVAILREVVMQRRIVGFDVVELAPTPGNVAPDFLAAKLVYRLIGYSLGGERGHAGQGGSGSSR